MKKKMNLANEFVVPAHVFDWIEEGTRTETLEDIFGVYDVNDSDLLSLAVEEKVANFAVSNHINKSGIDINQVAKVKGQSVVVDIIKLNTRTGLGLASSTNYIKQLNTGKRDNGKYFNQKARGKDMFIVFLDENNKPITGYEKDRNISVEELVRELNEGNEIDICAKKYALVIKNSEVPVMEDGTVSKHWLWEEDQVGYNQRKRLKKEFRTWPVADIEFNKGKVQPDLVLSYEEKYGYFEDELISLESKDLVKVLDAAGLKFSDNYKFIFRTVKADGTEVDISNKEFVPHAASVSLTRQGNTHLIAVDGAERMVIEGAIRALINKYSDEISLKNGKLSVSRRLFMSPKYKQLVKEMIAIGTMRYHEIMLEGNYIGLYADLQSTVLADIEAYQKEGKTAEEIERLENTYWYLNIAGIVEIDRVKKQLPVDGLIPFLEIIRKPKMASEECIKTFETDYNVDLSTILVKSGNGYSLSLDANLKLVKGEGISESQEGKVRKETNAYAAINSMADFFETLTEKVTEERTEGEIISKLYQELDLAQYRISMLGINAIIKSINKRNAALRIAKDEAYHAIRNNNKVDLAVLNKLEKQNASKSQIVKRFGHLDTEAYSRYMIAQHQVNSMKKSDYRKVIEAAHEIGINVKWGDEINERDLYVALMFDLYNTPNLDEKAFEGRRVTIRQLLPKGAASVQD